jgi:hypothetical protein
LTYFLEICRGQCLQQAVGRTLISMHNFFRRRGGCSVGCVDW